MRIHLHPCLIFIVPHHLIHLSSQSPRIPLPKHRKRLLRRSRQIRPSHLIQTPAIGEGIEIVLDELVKHFEEGMVCVFEEGRGDVGGGMEAMNMLLTNL